MKMRAVWLVAVCAIGSAQETPKTVTLESKAGTVESVLASVSKQTGVDYEAGSLKDRRVIASVKGMSPKRFLDTLAKVFDAEWLKSGNAFTLSRESNRVRNAEANETESRVPWIQKEAAKFLADNGAAEDWSSGAIDKRIKEDAEKRQKLADQMRANSGGNMTVTMFDTSSATPGALLLHEVLRKMPPRALAGVTPGQRLVWSDTPTRMQKSLPFRFASLDDFVRGYNRLIAANKSVADETTSNLRILSNFSKKGEPIDRVGKVIVTAQRFGAGLQINLLIVGPDGSVLDRPQAYLDGPTVEVGAVPEGATGQIEVSETSKALLRALQRDGGNGQSIQFQIDLGDNLTGAVGGSPTLRTLPKDVADVLADPIANEPLSFFVAESLLQLANRRKQDLIAAVPDDCFGRFARRLTSGRIGVGDFFKAGPALGLAISEGDGLITVAPLQQAEADRARVNRAEFGKLLGGIAKKGYASLDETCRYALAMPSWNEDNVDANWLQAYSPAQAAIYSNGQVMYYKLYGTLTPSQRQDNAQRVTLLANQMSNQQRALLEQIVFQPSGPQIVGRGAMTISATASGPAGPAGPPNQRPEPEIIQVEPTETFPNGLPPITRVQLQRRLQDCVFAIDESGRGRFLSAGDLGLRMGMDKGGLPPGMTIDASFSKYLLADLMTIQVTVAFGRQDRSATLRDESIKSGSQPVTYDKLPKSFTDNVDRARQRAMNMKTMSIGGRGTPPPLP